MQDHHHFNESPESRFHNHNISLCQSLRYKVQHEITEGEKVFYKNKAQHLRKNDCRKWWKIINKMSGKSEKTKPFSLERDGEILNDLPLSNALSEFYTSVNADIPPLDVYSLMITRVFTVQRQRIPIVQSYEVCKNLLSVQPFKASGPDNVPSRILKEFAYVLAEPITTIPLMNPFPL